MPTFRIAAAWTPWPARMFAACLLLVATAATAADVPAPVLRDVVVEGNTHTGRDIVLRVMGVTIGQPFPDRLFDTVWDRLEDSGFFAFVDLDREDEDGEVTLLVSVEEEKTLHYGPYARFSRRHKYLLGGWLRDGNLRGRGEVLELQVLAYRIQRLSAAWTKPWLGGRDGLSLRLESAWEQGGFVFRPFDDRTWHAGLALRQRFAGPFYAEMGSAFESFDQRDPYEETVPGDSGPSSLRPARTREDWLLRGVVGVDTRDNPYYPRQGIMQEFAVERRLDNGFPDLTLVSSDTRIFVDVPTAAILALHAYGRLADAPAAIERRLFYGGPETVRGAPYAQREGDEGYLLSVEIRYPLVLMPISTTGENVGFGLHAFADAGDAWGEHEDPGRALQSFGAGVHLNVATWQLRFEAAKERVHAWTFQFMDQFNF